MNDAVRLPSSSRARVILIGAAAVLVLGVGDGWAQGSPPQPETADAVTVNEAQSWPRRLHDALGLPEWLDLAVEHRSRYEGLVNPFRPGEPEHQSQYPQRTRVRVGADGFGPFRVLAEVQDARTHRARSDEFTTNQTNELDVLQLFVAATLPDLGGSGLRGDLHAGRLTLDFGSRRLLARNAHRNTTNAFDGVHAQLGSGDLSWRLRSFYVHPVTIQPEDHDESSQRQQFWGVAFDDRRLPFLNWELYYFGLSDRTTERRVHTAGTRLRRAAKAEQLDYEVELVGQLGDRAELDHSAFDGHAEVGYTFASPWSPRLSAQLEYASGTANPNGDESHTFDPLFGARRFDLIPTGIYGPFRRANIVSPGVGIGFAPLPSMRAQLRMRYWQLAQKKDAFVGSGLRDRTGAAGRRLGSDIELRLTWNPASWLQVDAGYDHWFKGSYFDDVPNAPTTDDTDYTYLATQVRF